MPFDPAAAAEPVGPLTAAVRIFAEMLADCDAFRMKVGAETQLAALESIYPIERMLQWAEDPDRPFAVVWCWPFAFGGHPLRPQSATLNLALSLPAVRGEDLEHGPPDFLAWLDEIVQQLADLSGVDERLVLQSCRPDGGIGVPDFNSQEKPCWRCTLQFVAGATGGGD